MNLIYLDHCERRKSDIDLFDLLEIICLKKEHRKRGKATDTVSDLS